jgi:hypothetical protein
MLHVTRERIKIKKGKRLKKGSFVRETREEYCFYSLQERKREVFNFKK